MKKCRKCNIEYQGDLDICPLCQTELVGSTTESVFPKVRENQEKLLHKILLFVTFSIGILFAFFEYSLSSKLHLIKYVSFGLITNYILVMFILNNYKNILKMMNRYFVVMLVLFFMWFFITKSLFITTYLIPIVCIIIFIYNSITMLIFKGSYMIKFGKTILLDCFIGLIPLLLILLKLTTTDMVSSICVVLDIIVFMGLLVFCKDDVIDEIKKTFHF